MVSYRCTVVSRNYHQIWYDSYGQDEAVVRKKTQQKVRLIENEAEEVRRNATAKASFVSGKAEADSQFLVGRLLSNEWENVL